MWLFFTWIPQITFRSTWLKRFFGFLTFISDQNNNQSFCVFCSVSYGEHKTWVTQQVVVVVVVFFCEHYTVLSYSSPWICWCVQFWIPVELFLDIHSLEFLVVWLICILVDGNRIATLARFRVDIQMEKININCAPLLRTPLIDSLW